MTLLMPAPSNSAIAFDTFTLAAVASELRRLCVGARVQKVQQPSPTDLVLAVYGKSGAQRLLLCADPQHFRVHLTQQKRENPINAPGFTQVCRKYLDGAFLTEVTMPRFDRVLRLAFRTHDGEQAALIAELMGRNANLVLVSGTGTVRGVLRPMPPGSERPLRVGQPYSDPPGFGDRVDPLIVTDTADPVFRDAPKDAAPDEMRAWLASTFSGIGRFGADEIAIRADGGGIAAALVGLMDDVRTERFAPHTVAAPDGTTTGVWAFEPMTVPAVRRFPRESVSIALDTFYATLTTRTVDAGEKDQLARTIAKEVVFRERELASARATLAEAARAETYERLGNNLLAQLGSIPRGAAEVTLPDLYADTTNATVTMTLDPKRSPQENADGYFQRARKARDAAEYADGRAADMESDLSRLRMLERELAGAESGAVLGPIRRELAEIVGAERAAGPKPQQQTRPKERPFGGHKIRTYTVEEFELLIGETAEANDYLVTRVAAPTDLWMHVRAATGAHGILRTQGRPERVPAPVVRRAAEIVAARSGSGVKHASVVAVDVTEKRYVRKPRAAKPGLVTYERERVLDVTPRL
jgi:predicted ribosome quality control (RQC) complex YloA/Tae2 family protein